jgi:heptosyltransferase-2
MGHDVSTLVMAAYTQVKYITNIVSVIPGNMGLSEVLTGYFATEMSIPFQQGVVVALVLRVASTLLSAAGALAATSMGVRRPTAETATKSGDTLLYFGPSGIGDWCFIHASLPALLARCGCSRIHAILPRRNDGNALLADSPMFSEVSYLDRVTRGPGLIGYGFRSLGLLLRLRGRRYGVLAISYLSTQPDFLLLAALSGIPDRIGAFERPMGRLARLAVNRPVALEPGAGKVESHRQYAGGAEEPSPVPPLFPPTVVARGAELRDRLARDGPYVVLGIGGGREASWRFWPAERYCALIVANPHIRFVLLGGGEADRAQAREIGAGAPANLTDLVGRTTMYEALAILSGARGVVGNDSGLTNMAVSLGTPSLTIYGPTDPKVSGAAVLGGEHLWSRTPEPCQPCYRDADGPAEALACPHRRCLTSIEVAEVETWLRALSSP